MKETQEQQQWHVNNKKLSIDNCSPKYPYIFNESCTDDDQNTDDSNWIFDSKVKVVYWHRFWWFGFKRGSQGFIDKLKEILQKSILSTWNPVSEKIGDLLLGHHFHKFAKS